MVWLCSNPVVKKSNVRETDRRWPDNSCNLQQEINITFCILLSSSAFRFQNVFNILKLNIGNYIYKKGKISFVKFTNGKVNHL